MELTRNKKILLIGGGVVLIVVFISLLSYYLWNSPNQDQPELLDGTVLINNIIKTKTLSDDRTFYTNANDGSLSFSAKSKKIVLRVPKNITEPTYNRDKKMEVETKAMNYLEVSLNQLCSMSFEVTDYNKKPLPVDLCLGAE